MIIKLHGETSLSKLPKILKEVVADIQARAGIEESKYTVKDAELGFLFTVNGEKMMLSSEIDGVKEPFVVHVKLDEKGNVVTKKDNDEESFMDDYTKAISKGLECPNTDPIESVYDDAELLEEYEEAGGDLVAKYYIHVPTNDRVIRYYRNGILVGEAGYKNREEL